MPDYLPLQLVGITERKDQETGEIRKTAQCRTVQPELINLNLSKLDAQRLQPFLENLGKVLMVPIRRGEINGRSFTSIADGFIFPAVGIESTFEIKDTNKPVSNSVVGQDNLAQSSDKADTLTDKPKVTSAMGGKL